MTTEENTKAKKEISRLRSEVRKIEKELSKKASPPKNTQGIGMVAGGPEPQYKTPISGNYWTQTGMPWASGDGRKAVLTEYFFQPIRGQPRRC